LIVAWHSGDTYRLDATEEAAQGGPRVRRLVIPGMVVFVALGATLVTAAVLNQPQPPTYDGISFVAQNTRRQAPPVVANPTPSATEPATPKSAPEAVARGEVKLAPAWRAKVAWVKPIPAEAKPVPVVKAPSQPPWAAKKTSPDDLRAQLLAVLEVSLDGDEVPKGATDARKWLETQTQTIAALGKKDPDAFVQQLVSKRADLAGLPWRRGKDCLLDGSDAFDLQHFSRLVRGALDSTSDIKARDAKAPDEIRANVYKFWSTLYKAGPCTLPAAVAVLEQVLTTENIDLRISLVEHLRTTDRRSAAAAIARRAVFDLDPLVRTVALEVLMDRPAKDYLPVLLDALQHPWAPAAERAAEALVNLQAFDAVPDLVRLLGEPDPTEPFLAQHNGKEMEMVREVVRVNHLRNCLLCHAPSTSKEDKVRAPIPVPGAALPVVYYEDFKGPSIRAEVTYLKQDFSVMQPVKNPDRWPAWQRFDYIVRVRPMTLADRVQRESWQDAGEVKLSDHKQALLYALRELTGMDTGTSAGDWQIALGLTQHEQVHAAELPGRAKGSK
jgi:hypothetical protein